MLVFVIILFLLVSGVGCGLWLWHSLDFSINFFCASHACYACAVWKTWKRTIQNLTVQSFFAFPSVGHHFKPCWRSGVDRFWYLFITINYFMFLWTCRLSYVLWTLVILTLIATILPPVYTAYGWRKYPTWMPLFIWSTSNHMSFTYRFVVTISPLRLQSASSVQILHSAGRSNSLLPTVNVTPLELPSVSSINLYRASNNNLFRNRLRIILSPLKSPILRKYNNPYKGSGMYPSISKCNAKTCCKYLNCKTTVVCIVNNRQFSVVNNSSQ